jgi:S-formylglutathione hydrolase FrmB
MKKVTLISAILLLTCIFIADAQQFIKVDASFYSPVLDEVKMVDIYLPADYYVNPEQQYACIYYLHGGGGNQNTGNNHAMFYYNFHNEDTTISSPPAIFVCPDASCEPFLGSMYVNSELYGNYEDYIMQDIIGFVESNFRAIPHKNFRMITGFSMGGFGSASLSSKYPEKFRACVPMSGGFSKDSILENFRTRCYQEHGSYNLTYSGFYTQVLFTFCGGYSPNMDIEPYHIEIPFDTLGNWQDPVINKWSQHEVVRRVKNLPDENELAWFLICGRQDNLAFFPTYNDFTDNLDLYGIGYDTSYFEGGHVFNIESWITAIHWMDSIIEQSYQTLGIPVYRESFGNFNVFPIPAKDQLTLSCQLNKAGTARVCIFNMIGQLVETVNLGNQQPGEHHFELNIADYKPGIYFCRLQIGNEVLTKKIVKAN